MSLDWDAPPQTPSLNADELHIWRTSLDREQADVREFAASLSVDERERANRFVFVRDRERFVVARGMLRRILGAYLDVEPGELRFSYNAYGKPALAAPATGERLAFNLAHSGALALYALVHGRQVGVDLELIREDLAYPSIIPGIFTAREQAILATLPSDQQRLAFFCGWARKEAYLKARGEGLSYPPDSFEVSLLANEPPLIRLPPGAGSQRWVLYPLDLGAGYAAAVVVEGGGMRLRRFWVE